MTAPLPPPLRLHPNLAELYRKKVEQLHQLLSDPFTAHEALTRLRTLIDRVDMKWTKDGFEIVLTGEIAQMVQTALATGNKIAALGARTACSVKVVAGVGFELPTFRL